MGHGSLQVWELKSDSKQFIHYSCCLSDNGLLPDTIRPLHPLTERIPVISRSVQFADRGESVLVFYLESHEV